MSAANGGSLLGTFSVDKNGHIDNYDVGYIPKGIFAGLGYWNSFLYVWPAGEVLRSFCIKVACLTSKPGEQPLLFEGTEIATEYQGIPISISSNYDDQASAVIWAVLPTQDPKVEIMSGGRLVAYRADDLLKIPIAGGALSTGNNCVKFMPPLVVNGKIYVVTTPGSETSTQNILLLDTKMKTFPLFALLYLTVHFELDGQTLFFNQARNVFSGNGLSNSVVADFNSDGNLDLVVAFQDGRFEFLAGDGKGGFTAPILISRVFAPIMFISSSDLNKDKFLDLIVATETETFAFLGRGNGSFQTPPSPAARSYPLFVGDVNRDGFPDLVQWGMTPDCSFNAVKVQLGNGDGTFQPVLTPCVRAIDGDMSQNAVVGDFNADGIPDFAWLSARSNCWISVHLGLGDGTFRSATRAGGGSSQCTGIAVGDLDGDGVLDLVAANGTVLNLSSGRGDGTFSPPLAPIILPSGSFQSSNGLFVADFDGDGNADVAWGSGLLLGRNDGTFSASVNLLLPSPYGNIRAAGDFNRDGRTDLLTFRYNQPTYADNVWVLLNAGPKFPNAELAFSAASGAASIAPNSIASVFGTNLASQTMAANTSTLPTRLGGISLHTRDSTGTIRLAPLYYVSPTQINFLVPAEVTGLLTLTVDDGSSPLLEAANATAVTSVSAGFFTSNGIPAATAARLLPGGKVESVSVSSCDQNAICSLLPIDLTNGQVYLTLYGTGFRNIVQISNFRCTVGGLNALVTFAGAQPSLPGLDQLNLIIPSLVVHGTANVVCFVLGTQINPIQLLIK